MSLKKHIKNSLKLIIDSDGNPITLIIRASKKEILKTLDRLLPDDELMEESAK